MPPPEPTRLGAYELLEKLGHGGMAQVYRGERTAEGGFKKQVAIKRMLPQYRRNPSLLERFAAEARTNARLDHPNLVTVVDFGIEPEPYLVMEYVEGVTLASLLSRLVEKGESLEISAALFIGAEAAQGLDHAHRKRDDKGNPLGIVHRDVSPQNVLLSNEGSVKVSDFGLVKAADNVVQTGTGVPIGKISYMAPEQADQHDVDARADVFSLGVVIWEMLTLRTLMPPNDPVRASHMLMSGDFPPPSRYRPEISADLERIVMACLARDPANRTPSAQQLGMQLRERLHDRAPGYGRDQLARLLSWAFPERGWAMDEPHNTAAQPSVAERASMPQVPAAEAMQRASRPPPEPAASQVKTVADVAPAVAMAAPVVPAMRAAVHPSPEKKGIPIVLWILVFVGLMSVVAVIALTLLYVLMSAASAEESDEQVATVSEPAAPMAPLRYEATTFSAEPDGAAIFLGPEQVGVAPVSVRATDLGSQPMVAIVPGYHPEVLSVGDQGTIVSSQQSAYHFTLTQSSAPRRAIYVQTPWPATIRLRESGTVLGASPGLVLIDPTPLGGMPWIELVSPDGRVERIPTRICAPDTLCVLEGRAR